MYIHRRVYHNRGDSPNLSRRSGLEREDMQVFYHYLTTMLFPKHLVMSDVEVRMCTASSSCVDLSMHRSEVYSCQNGFSQQQCTVVL